MKNFHVWNIHPIFPLDNQATSYYDVTRIHDSLYYKT